MEADLQQQSHQVKKFDNQELNEFQEMALQVQQEESVNKEQMEQNLLQIQVQEIENDRGLTEEQKRIKIEMLKHKDKSGRVHLIMEKHNQRTKQRKGVPMKRESRFENQMKIFKNLNTFLESKEMMQKLNQLNKEEQARLLKKSTVNQIQIKDLFEQYNSEMQVFNNRSLKENQNEYIFQEGKHNHLLLIQKVKQVLQDKTLTLQDSEESYLSQLLRQISGIKEKRPSKEEDRLEEQQAARCDQFYLRLEDDIQKGKFLKSDDAPQQPQSGDLSKFDVKQLQSYFLHESEVAKGSAVRNPKLKPPQDEGEQYQVFQQKAKKILNLIVKTSKNLFNKNIMEVAQTVEFQRQIHREKVRQRRLNQEALKRQLAESKIIHQNTNKEQTEGSQQQPTHSEQQIQLKEFQTPKNLPQNANIPPVLRQQTLAQSTSLNLRLEEERLRKAGSQEGAEQGNQFFLTGPQETQQTQHLPKISQIAEQSASASNAEWLNRVSAHHLKSKSERSLAPARSDFKFQKIGNLSTVLEARKDQSKKKTLIQQAFQTPQSQVPSMDVKSPL